MTRTSAGNRQHIAALLVRWTFEVLSVAAAYAVAALIGLQFAIPPGSASAVWPSSGIALAALLLRSRSIAPGIWLGSFVANTHNGVSLLVAAAFATGNTLAAIVAATLCRRWLDANDLFRRPLEAFLWLLIAAVSCLLAATCGAATLYLGGYVQPDQLLANWSTWWLGDLAGIMLIAPVLISAKNWRLPWSRPERLVELLVAFATLVVISQALFGGWLPESRAEGLLYLPMIVLLWLLLRFGLDSLLFGNLLIAVLAVWGTSTNVGAFATESIANSLFDLQLFLTIYAFTGLTLSGLLRTGRDAERQQLALRAEVEDNAASLAVAHEIQQSLFPSAPLQGDTYMCTGVCHAAEAASGDYFDYFRQPDGSVVMVIADVSGHGLGPALLMAETRAYARALLSTHVPLDHALAKLNHLLLDDLYPDMFVTLLICRMDPHDRTIEYIGAGHEGLLIRADGATERLHASTIPLGLSSKLLGAEVNVVEVRAGDLVVGCTDGFTESRGPDRDLYGRERLTQVLIAHRKEDPEQLLLKLADDVARFSNTRTPRDDQTAVVLSVR